MIITEKEFELQRKDGGESWSTSEILDCDDLCFFCGKPLSVPFAYWSGAGKSLCLHLECAGRLGGGLFRDFIEAKDGKAAADDWWRPLRNSFKS
jgi:hypothetical protein